MYNALHCIPTDLFDPKNEIAVALVQPIAIAYSET